MRDPMTAEPHIMRRDLLSFQAARSAVSLGTSWALPVSDVRAAGVVGDGVTDDTTAIQEALLRSPTLYFPAGAFVVTRSLRLRGPDDGGPFACGSLLGAGAPENPPWQAAFQPAGTTFVWRGPPDEPMFIVDRAKRVRVSDCAFVGAAGSGAPTAGPLWLFCKRPGADFGVGASLFDNVVFASARVGVQFGERKEDTNCDTTSFFHCIFKDLGSGVTTMADQSLGFRFIACFASRCGSFLTSRAGGHVLIAGLSCSQCGTEESAIFDIVGGGSNAIDFTLDGVRIENRSRLVLRTRGLCSVLMRNFAEAQIDEPRPLFDVHYGVVRIDGGRIASAGSTRVPFLALHGDLPRPAHVDFSCVRMGVSAAAVLGSIALGDFSSVTLTSCVARGGIFNHVISK